MDKKFVLDTNVLLHDPTALERFAGEEIVVPIYAIEEIDKFKRELSERGRNARWVSRTLDHLRQTGGLSDGVVTGTGGQLRVAFADPTTDVSVAMNRPAGSADDLILAVALREQNKEPGKRVVFVTRDINLRIRADALGLQAEDYHDARVEIADLYAGTAEIEVASDVVDAVYRDGEVPFQGSTTDEAEIRPNQYVLLRDATNSAHTALACFKQQGASSDGGTLSGKLRSVRRFKEGVWGIRPRNKEQHFGLDALLDPDVDLVTLVGKAGTGKTLLAIAAGLHSVLEDSKHRKLLVSRPIFPLGRDIGFLPGDVEEKLNPWMQPIFDNLELLLGNQDGKDRSYREFLDMGYVQVEPLTYIRGRSIPNQYIIVDEAQNLTPHEVKTIVTRVGEGTKIVLTGDPYQIDNPYVDSANNGLSTAVERFKAEGLTSHVTLHRGERSELAELAANIL